MSAATTTHLGHAGRAGRRPHVAVVGGGITGLATAYHLRHGLDGIEPGLVDVTLLESTARTGGKLLADQLAGHTVDLGAEAFLSRQPAAERLARAVGLGDELVAPATSRVLLLARGRLRPLPEGTILGVPTSLLPLLRSGAISLGGALRVGLDLVLPREPRVEDRSVGDLVAERFGHEIVDALVEPLLGGVYAGDPANLGVQSTSPMLYEAARNHRSVLLGLRAGRREALAGTDPDAPFFLTVRGGLGRLAATVRERLDDVDVRTAQPARIVERTGDGRWRVRPASGEPVVADVVVLTVPAYVAAALLREVDNTVSARLREVDYASVATVALAYPRGAVDHPLDASGLLVPRREGRAIKAATFVSSKWPQHADGEHALIRASLGRAGDDALDRSDDQLMQAAHRDVAELLGVAGEPTSARVTRWERALPQYGVRHVDRVAELRRRLAANPGLLLAGAAYDGVGVAACVTRAEEVARTLLADVVA